ncbi:unnamed protein product [Sphagnum troendelagicum]
MNLVVSDKNVHNWNFASPKSLTKLTFAIAQRIGDGNFHTNLPHIMYLNDEGDQVLLATNEDLVATINFACISDKKVVTLHLEDDAIPKA